MTKLQVLGTPLLVTDYDELSDSCLDWARQNSCVAMDFSNTQIVTMRRHEAAFRELTNAYDAFSPDGMPLIWCLNRAGARMRDRVYGPTFMRHFLLRAPGNVTHYLLGGSEDCAQKLREIFLRQNPALKFVGSFHGKCCPDGTLDGAAEQEVVDELNRLSPDFIWVCFGAPKQQNWVSKHKRLLKRGVVMTVGFAFEVNAGVKPDAPDWMQRRGLTWIYRLCSEPRRLALRYIKYNSLFLFYLLRDGLRGRAWGKT